MPGITTSPNTKSMPLWAKDFGGREHIVPFPAKLDVAAFPDHGGITVTLTEAVADTDTSMTVVALESPLKVGDVVTFGTGAYVVVTAPAAVGATVVSIAAAILDIADNSVGNVPRFGKKMILSGTLCGRTYAERAASSPFGPWATGDDEVFLLMFTLDDAINNNDAEFYRHQGLVAENYLPFWTNATLWDATAKAALRANYTTILGQGG